MSTTEYNGAYKGEVISLLKQAISGLKSCKSVSIDIPSDFEAAGTLRNALNVLKGIDIKGVVSEIKSASADFERAENELNNYLGRFLSLVQHKKNNNEKNVPLDEWNEIGNPNNKDKFFSYVYRVNDTKTKISFPYKQLEKSKNQNVLAGFASDDVSSGLEKLLSLKNNKDSKAILLDKTQVSTALEKIKKSTSINKTKSYIAIEEEKKGKEKIRDQERTKYFGGKSIAEEEKRKGIELLDKKLVAAKNLIRHNNYPNETQILLETLKAEEQYAHDGKMLGYSKAMKNGDVKKVLDIVQKKDLTEAQQLIVAAECIHSYLENSVKNDNPNDNYKYYTETFDKLNKTFEDSKESYKNVCCATYVSWVLKEIGYLKDDDIKSKETMHKSVLLNQLFKEKKEQFTEVDESQGLKAGDILFYDYGSGKGHIEIFAGYDENGDKVIYNCGSDYWIASEFPSARDGSSFQTKKKTPTRVWRIIDK